MPYPQPRLYEDAWNRFNRSGLNGVTCFCGCGSDGFWTTSGWTVGLQENQDASEGNEAWHPKPNAGVYLWKLASEHVPEFSAKATKVMPENIRARGKLMGAGTTGIQQGVRVCVGVCLWMLCACARYVSHSVYPFYNNPICKFHMNNCICILFLRKQER